MISQHHKYEMIRMLKEANKKGTHSRKLSGQMNLYSGLMAMIQRKTPHVMP